MKKIIFIISILIGVNSLAQVGVNKLNPTSTLDNNGSISYKTEEINVSKTLGINDHFINYIGTSINTISLPSDNNITGRIYYIKNASNVNVNVQANNSQTIRVGYANGVSLFTILPGQTFKFIRSNNVTLNAWESSKIENPIVNTTRNVLYSTLLKVPPSAVNSAQYPTYSTNNWKLIAVTNTIGDRIRGQNRTTSGGRTTIGFKASKLDLTYEYQGVPFNVNKLYPIITAGNSNASGILLIPSFAKIENNTTTGKTTLRVSVARTDVFGVDSTSNNGTSTTDNNQVAISQWTDTNAFMNVLIATQIN